MAEEITVEQGVAARIARGSTTFGCGHEVTVENSLWKSKGPKWVLGCRECNKLRGKRKYDERAARGARQLRPKCRFGHEYPPDLIPEPGKNRTCPTCQGIRDAKRSARERSAEFAKKHDKGRCGTCGLQFDKKNPTTQKPYCSRCQRRRVKQWHDRKRLNIPTVVSFTRYASTKEKIVGESELDADGCRLWNGFMQNGTLPKVACVENRRFRSVRVVLWEMREGAPPPEGHNVLPKCGKHRCISEDCFMLKPWIEVIHSNIDAARKTRQLALPGRDRYVTAALKHLAAVRIMLRRKFANLARFHEDIIQELLLRMYLQWARKRVEIKNLKQFMMTMTVRITVDVARYHKTRREVPLLLSVGGGGGDGDGEESEELDPPAPETSDPEVLFQQLERQYAERAAIVQRLKLVPRRARQAFRLQVLEDLSQKEIAVALKISENTVEQHLTKARKLFFSQPRRIIWRRAV
jgi:RNA polymerase sigma factor (sigma-70 family)